MQTAILRAPFVAASLLLSFLWTGCTTTAPSGTAKADQTSGSAPTIEIVRWLPAGTRVALLPIYTRETLGSAQQDMDVIFRGELTKALPYELVQVSRPELMGILHREQISSAEAIPPEAFRALREKYGVSAVMFTDVTLYRPYRPIAIGIRAKLVSMDSLEVLWAADRVIDSADQTTAQSAIHFADPSTKASSARANQVILQSPRRFAAFAASEIYSTMPVQ
jgi:hypothetical protein